MRIIIRTKNCRLEERIKSYIQEKFGALEKFLQLWHSGEKWEKMKSACEFFVEVKKEDGHHKKGIIFKAKSRINLPGQALEAETSGQTPKEAIDSLRDEILGEIKKNKDKEISRSRRRERVAKKEFHLSSGARLYRKGRIREEGM